ncbi:glycosyltransferase [Levilactobacillus tujiorum]|uniref:glycosyltransferase n=1 Tax=Levilactobacillus tujiorum TaxID=2912243 RepID=UPI001456E36A|nr:glycosyltransferase [Levilactobacillus tujiorum]NLR31735.1 glycosyltransferase [Levilactobacillus tujiorum]
MTEKTKIDLIAANLSGHGGTETVIKYVLNDISIGEEVNFDVFLTGKASNAKWLKSASNLGSIEVLHSNNKVLKLLGSLWHYMWSKADVVLALGTGQIVLAYIIRKIFRKKYKLVSWIHFSILGISFINPRFLKYADYHLAISSEIEEQLVQLGINRNRISIIYNPVVKQERQIKRKKDGVIKLIYVGRVDLVGQKNLKEMLDGLSQYEESWHLDIFGTGETERVSKYAETLRMQEKITFHGWVDNVWGQLKEVDALLLTSTFEGLPMVLTEAVSRGIPCVAADCPVGPRDIIKNGVNGCLYQCGDLEGFLKALNSVVRNPDYKSIPMSIDNLYGDRYNKRFVNALNSWTH